jgi:hypothetical protein
MLGAIYPKLTLRRAAARIIVFSVTGGTPHPPKDSAASGIGIRRSAKARPMKGARVFLATELQGMLPAGFAGRVTMGFGNAMAGEGGLLRLLGTTEPGGYLRPGLTLNVGEIMAAGVVTRSRTSLRMLRPTAGRW